MMATLSRAQILARKVYGTTESVELSDGGEVIVRGMTRGEARELSALDDEGDVENTALHYGLVEPALSLEDVAKWIANEGSGEVQKVVNAIQRLSGTDPGQAKEFTKSVP
jgi:hypothetical protein